MDINSISGASRVHSIYANSTRVSRQAYGKGAKAGGSDNVVISNQAMDFKSVLEAVSKVPDVREEKVTEVQGRMDRGEYIVSSADIANRIMTFTF